MGLPSHLLQEVHVHEEVLGGGGMSSQQDGGWEVILLSDSSTWFLAFQYVRELVFRWHHLSHLNIPERVASMLKLDSFLPHALKGPGSFSQMGVGGRKEEREERNGEEMWPVSDIQGEHRIQCPGQRHMCLGLQIYSSELMEKWARREINFISVPKPLKIPGAK